MHYHISEEFQNRLDYSNLLFLGGDKNKDRFFGVELEFSVSPEGEELSNGNDDEIWDKIGGIHALSNDGSLFEIKTDPTVDNGIEIATTPATLDYHRNTFPWGQLSKLAYAEDLVSERSNSVCGLHIHMNRDSLKVDNDIFRLRLFMFFVRHWEHLLHFSRRGVDLHSSRPLHDKHDYSYSRNYDPGLVDTRPTNEWTQTEIGKLYTTHTSCIDYRYVGDPTIEFRLPRGSLRPEVIIAAIEMMNFITEFCHNHDFDYVKTASSWRDIAAEAADSNPDFLAPYLKERNLA